VLRLTADDGEASAYDDVPISVLPLNQAPIVDAGPDLSVDAPAPAILLAGAVSDDGRPVGNPVDVTWSVVFASGEVTFTDPSSATTSAGFELSGAYVLRLSASDGELLASDDVIVFVNPGNTPPVVNAGPDLIGVVGQPRIIEGSVVDDGLPSYSFETQWTKLSGTGQYAPVGARHLDRCLDATASRHIQAQELAQLVHAGLALNPGDEFGHVAPGAVGLEAVPAAETFDDVRFTGMWVSGRRRCDGSTRP
jgi:hypothetical protein